MLFFRKTDLSQLSYNIVAKVIDFLLKSVAPPAYDTILHYILQKYRQLESPTIRGRTDYFSNTLADREFLIGCYLFIVSNPGLLFNRSRPACAVTGFSLSLFSLKGTLTNDLNNRK